MWRGGPKTPCWFPTTPSPGIGYSPQRLRRAGARGSRVCVARGAGLLASDLQEGTWPPRRACHKPRPGEGGAPAESVRRGWGESDWPAAGDASPPAAWQELCLPSGALAAAEGGAPERGAADSQLPASRPGEAEGPARSPRFPDSWHRLPRRQGNSCLCLAQALGSGDPGPLTKPTRQ